MRGEWEAVVGDVPIEVVAYPIDLAHFDVATPSRRAAARAAIGIGEDEFAATFVGRLEDIKGPHVLLTAARRLHDSGLPVRVVIQGAPGLAISADVAGRYRELCVAEAGSCPISWVPPGPDVRDAVHAADACVVPSIWPEPSGLTVAEAMATGTPLVASAVGGIPEQVPRGSTQARLVAPSDPGALAVALVALRENPPSEAERHALRGHVVASRNLPKLTRHYRAALEGGP
jgi:glycosyltransferase involved in cell wall biosynthesis